MSEDSSRAPTVYIHADESCLGNQFEARANPGGAAGLVEHWSDGAWLRRDIWVSDPDTTNNRMAIRSAIESLRALKRACRVIFVSDSQYLVKGMGEWVPGWERRGWRRKGGPIKNLELWQTLDREAKRHVIDWQWVRGHAGHPKNEYANVLAVRAAKELTDSHPPGMARHCRGIQFSLPSLDPHLGFRLRADSRRRATSSLLSRGLRLGSPLSSRDFFGVQRPLRRLTGVQAPGSLPPTQRPARRSRLRIVSG
jgi:ribonuclease HI